MMMPNKKVLTKCLGPTWSSQPLMITYVQKSTTGMTDTMPVLNNISQIFLRFACIIIPIISHP